MNDAGEKFVHEFVLMFGFLGGIWLRVGISPEGAISEAIVEIIKAINPEIAPLIAILFTVLAIVFFIGSIIGAYGIGGHLGLLAVILAIIAGYFLSEFGVILLFFAIIIGWVAPDST
jgi:hypothetical protein